MNIISNYEKKFNISLSKEIKKRLSFDIDLFVTKKKPKKRSSKSIFGELTIYRGIVGDYHIYCPSKEEYLRCAESVIVFDLSYEDEVKKLIRVRDIFYDEVHYLSLKHDIIKVLFENGIIDDCAIVELIKRQETPKIKY